MLQTGAHHLRNISPRQTLATIDNGLVLLGASDFTRQFIQGAAIVIAVVVDSVIQRRVRDLLKLMRRRGRAA